MKIRFDFDGKKCSACGACAIACMDQNDVDVQRGQQPYRRVYQYESDGQFVSISTACRHCEDAPCIDVCPSGCLFKDERTGLTLYDTRNCVGCHACSRVCPYDAPSFRPPKGERKRDRMEKCHGCLARIGTGLQPACVHTCPTGALTWRWAEDDWAKPESPRCKATGGRM